MYSVYLTVIILRRLSVNHLSVKGLKNQEISVEKKISVIPLKLNAGYFEMPMEM